MQNVCERAGFNSMPGWYSHLTKTVAVREHHRAGLGQTRTWHKSNALEFREFVDKEWDPVVSMKLFRLHAG